MKKGEIMHQELFGFIIFLILLLLIAPLIQYLMSEGITGPMEKGFSVLTDRIEQVSSSSDSYLQSTSIDITLEDGYALYGFDADYSPSVFVSRIDNPRERSQQGAYSTHDDQKILKPGACHTGKACLCLAEDCDHRSGDYPGCITWKRCRSFEEDMVLAGIPFYDPRLHSPEPELDPIRLAYRDEGVYSYKKFGLPRQRESFHQRFTEQGMNRSWSDWYGYLYVRGPESGTLGLYLEKFDDGKTTYMLLIPRYPRIGGGIPTIDESVLEYRENLLKRLEKTRKKKLTQAIQDSHDAAQNDKSKYLDLYHECRRYESTFPNDPQLPDACDRIARCAPHPERISDSDCRVDPDMQPCVCGEDSPSLCAGEHNHCYEAGCVTSRREGKCAV